MRKVLFSLWSIALLTALLIASAQAETQLAGLECELIPIPTWTSGAVGNGVSAKSPARTSSPSTLRPTPCTSLTVPIWASALSTHGPTRTRHQLWSGLRRSQRCGPGVVSEWSARSP